LARENQLNNNAWRRSLPDVATGDVRPVGRRLTRIEAEPRPGAHRSFLPACPYAFEQAVSRYVPPE